MCALFFFEARPCSAYKRLRSLPCIRWVSFSNIPYIIHLFSHFSCQNSEFRPFFSVLFYARIQIILSQGPFCIIMLDIFMQFVYIHHINE